MKYLEDLVLGDEVYEIQDSRLTGVWKVESIIPGRATLINTFGNYMGLPLSSDLYLRRGSGRIYTSDPGVLWFLSWRTFGDLRKGDKFLVDGIETEVFSIRPRISDVEINDYLICPKHAFLTTILGVKLYSGDEKVRGFGTR